MLRPKWPNRSWSPEGPLNFQFEITLKLKTPEEQTRKVISGTVFKTKNSDEILNDIAHLFIQEWKNKTSIFLCSEKRYL